MTRRHKILLGSIGTTALENKSYRRTILGLQIYYPSLVALTGFQFLSYFFFNQKCHPFNEILEDGKKVNMPEEVDLMEKSKEN